MKMTPQNIILFVLAIIVGLWLGQSYPIIGLILLIPVLGYVVLVFMRNKSGEKAGPEATAGALRMTPPPGKARLFVMRKGFVGGQQGLNITIDGRLESQIRSKYFLYADLEPGTHSVKAKMSSGSESAARTHELVMAAGDIVLLDIKFNIGALQGTPDFTEVRGGVEARAMLEGCRLVLWKTGA